MTRKFRIVLAVLAGVMPVAGSASGDYSCTQEWRLFGAPKDDDYGLTAGGRDCGDRPMLWPANDTRSNLFMLARGGQGFGIAPKPYPALGWDTFTYGRSFYNWNSLGAVYGLNLEGTLGGGGAICDGLEGGNSAFAEALGAAKALSGAERAALVQARAGLGKACDDKHGGIGTPQVASAAGKAFLAYLEAAEHFYAGEWDAARGGFAAIAKVQEPWVAETATYMAIRVELNAAQQKAFDEYGTFKGAKATDAAALARAGAAIDAYLAHYPAGLYAASAKGLRRRVAWLGGDYAALGAAYEAALAEVTPDGAAALIQEIDAKYLFAEGAFAVTKSPMLLAAMDLARMRGKDEGKPLSAAELEAQKPLLAGRPELYTYLAATRALTVEGDAKAALALIPATPPAKGMSPLALSVQGLRGVALARLGAPEEEAHWRALIAVADAPFASEFAQFGLALLWQRSGRLGQVFAHGSPVTDDAIRQMLLSRLAGPDLLRAAVADKSHAGRTHDLALLTLLHKDLRFARFADFGRDIALLPADTPVKGDVEWLAQSSEAPVGLFVQGKWGGDYTCPAIAVTARTLASKVDDPQALLCLGEFWRLNGFDRLSDLDPYEDAGRLGGGKSLFTGTPLSRTELYIRVLTNPRASADDKAYALYRRMRCYAPVGNNDCGGTDVPLAVRRGWFFEMRKRYPASRWTQSLRYYW